MSLVFSTFYVIFLSRFYVFDVFITAVVQGVRRWTYTIGRSRVQFLYSRKRCVTTLGKLFTPMCLCHQAVYALRLGR